MKYHFARRNLSPLFVAGICFLSLAGHAFAESEGGAAPKADSKADANAGKKASGKPASLYCTSPANESLSLKTDAGKETLVYRELTAGKTTREHRFTTVSVNRSNASEGAREMVAHGLKFEEKRGTVESIFVKFVGERADVDFQLTQYQTDLGLMAKAASQGSVSHEFETHAKSRLICKPDRE